MGCITISQPVFLPPQDWVREPADFSRNIVRGAGYDLAEGEGRRMWEECLARSRGHIAGLPLVAASDDGPRFGAPQLVQPRLGQGTFRIAVTRAYGGACSITGEQSLPVLDVAHIRSYAAGGTHEIRNGRLLRADIHRLFDRGYVTITPDYHFEVSRRLRDEYANGRAYYQLHGNVIALPQRASERPNPELLRWHNEHVFAA